MKQFEFLLPDGNKHMIEYDDTSNKIEIVNDILNKWASYIDDCWIYTKKIDPYKLNHEDRVKLMLNALAAFLDGSSMGEIKQNEISLQYVENNQKQKNSTLDSNDVLVGIKKDYETYQNKNKRKIKKYSQSKMYKLTRIFSKESTVRQELYKLKNKDVYSPESYSYIKLKFKFIDDEELNKWLEKPAKNVFGQNIFSLVNKTYKGWLGIIDVNKPYLSKWCYVYSDGTFKFNNKTYKIDLEKIIQYKDIRKDKYYRDEKNISMDNIYCVEQNGKLFFWDMNISRIKNDYISNVG